MHPSLKKIDSNMDTDPNGPFGYRMLSKTEYTKYILRSNNKDLITLHLHTSRNKPLVQVEAFIYFANQKDWFWAKKLYRDNNAFQAEAFTQPTLQKKLALVMRQFKNASTFHNATNWCHSENNNETYHSGKGTSSYDLAVFKMESSQRYFHDKNYEKAISETQQAFTAILSMQAWDRSAITEIITIGTNLSKYLQLLGAQCIQDAEKAIVIFKNTLDVIEKIDNARIGESKKTQIRLVLLKGFATCQTDLTNQYASHIAKLLMPAIQATTTTCSSSKKQQLKGLNQSSAPSEEIKLSEKEEKEDSPKGQKSDRLFQNPVLSKPSSDSNVESSIPINRA